MCRFKQPNLGDHSELDAFSYEHFISHNDPYYVSSPIFVLVPFRGWLLISVVESKIQNKFLITFGLLY
jgi:hypothetical protein